MDDYLKNIILDIHQLKHSTCCRELKEKVLNGTIKLENEHLLILYQEKLKVCRECETRKRQSYEDIIKNITKSEYICLKKKVKLFDKCIYYF